jgi:hypothetical protein
VNLRACRSLTTSALTGTWYRAIDLQFWDTLLATDHSSWVPARFNAGDPERAGFEILYFAEDHQVALFEVRALLGSPLPGQTHVPNPRGHWILISAPVPTRRNLIIFPRKFRPGSFVRFENPITGQTHMIP